MGLDQRYPETETFLANIKFRAYPLAFLFLAGLVVFPLLYKRIPGLVPHYSKAHLKSRAFALMIDIFVALPLLYLLYIVMLFYFYFSFRDALLGGQSVGKLLTGLVITRTEDGKPAGLKRVVLRNIVFLVPGANIAGVIWESVFVCRSKAGYRLGDKIAQTQVVEGKRVLDLASYIQEGLLQRLLRETLRLEQMLRRTIFRKDAFRTYLIEAVRVQSHQLFQLLRLLRFSSNPELHTQVNSHNVRNNL